MKKLIYITLIAASVFPALRLSAADTELTVRDRIAVQPHHGKVQYSLDLYTIPDIDFQWTIGLQNTSGGYTPYAQDGNILGINWRLKAGGVITRRIMGRADDKKDESDYSDEYEYYGGYYAYVTGTENKLSKEALYTNPSSVHSDLMPDIFDFSFGGYSGSFMITYSGEGRVVHGDFVYVDLSRLVLQNNRGHYNRVLPDTTSSIILYTQDGTAYYFGGTRRAIEYADEYSENNMHNTPDITAWHLVKVVAANGRTMRFHYHPTHGGDSTLLVQAEYPWQVNYIGNQGGGIVSVSSIYPSDFEQEGIWHCLTQNTCYAAHKVRLDSITIDDMAFCLRFGYATWNRQRVVHTCTHNEQRSFVLQQITAGIGQQALCQWDIRQDTLAGSPVPLRWLSAVSNGIETYNYRYDTTGLHSLQNLGMTDHTVLCENTDLYGIFVPAPKLFTLCNIQNPLGRQVSLEYGMTEVDSLHLYSLSANAFIMVKVPATYQPVFHAPRINSITTKDRNGNQLSKKQYEYTLGGKSTGIWDVDYGCKKQGNNYSVIGSMAYGVRPYDVVTYTFVRETMYGSGNSEEWQKQYRCRHKTAAVCPFAFNYGDGVMRFYPYMEIESGNRSYIEEILAGNNSIVTNRTHTTPSRQDTCWFLTCDGDNNKMQLPYYTSRDILRVAVEDHNGDSLVGTIRQTLDDYGRIASEEKAMGEDTLLTTHTYAEDLVHDGDLATGNEAFACRRLITRHRTGEPIESVQYVRKNGHDYVTGAQYYQYFYTGNVPQPANSPSYASVIPPAQDYAYTYLNKIYSLDIESPVSDFQPVTLSGGSLSSDGRYTLRRTMHCNRYLRMTDEKGEDGIVTRYVWDNSQQYVVQKQTGHLVTSYTWQPYVGMTSVTDENGYTTYFVYDTLGRLVEEYEMVGMEKHVLRKYDYHYSTEE